MTRTRASTFDEEGPLALAGFAPKAAQEIQSLPAPMAAPRREPIEAFLALAEGGT